MRSVDIFTDRGPISILLVALKGGMVLFGIFLLVQAFGRGEVGQVLWGGLALIAGGALFGGYDLIKLLDRSPQLTLSEEGFCDHRAAVPVVIPWDHFGALGYRSAGSSGWTHGDSHYSDEGIARDSVRTAYLRRLGYSVLRLTNDDVLGSDDGVFEVLRGVLGEPDR